MQSGRFRLHRLVVAFNALMTPCLTNITATLVLALQNADYITNTYVFSWNSCRYNISKILIPSTFAKAKFPEKRQQQRLHVSSCIDMFFFVFQFYLIKTRISPKQCKQKCNISAPR